jgi:tRNA U34 5-methylaminomethyl-2-thiouridine-forming methyltransferase MnmC
MVNPQKAIAKNYKYLTRYTPKDQKYIMGIINMGGGILEIGGLEGHIGFRQVHKLENMIIKQVEEKKINNLIQIKTITLNSKLLRISLNINHSKKFILSKEQVPLLLGSQVLFKTPSLAKEFKLWINQLTSFELNPKLWDDFQDYQLKTAISFNQSERDLILQKSEDGSHTLFIPEMNETYHSTKGSRTEAEYVFLKHGIEFTQAYNQKKILSILEIGFGTGLNAWLTLKNAIENKTRIDFQTLEPFPIPIETLNYLEFGFENKIEKEQWMALHQYNWTKSHRLNSIFQFQKNKKKLEDFYTEKSFDLIFFDAFAPSKQPELWSLEVFHKCFGLLASKGCLVSYCASSLFKKNLLLAGFKIQVLKGPPGKREMVRALKI